MAEGRIWGFIMWLAGGGLVAGLGVYAFFAKKAVGFFNNVAPLPMRDVKAYNRAVGKLFIAYAAGFMLLGIPLIAGGQNSPAVIISVLGVMAETIAAMTVYILVIQKKYELK